MLLKAKSGILLPLLPPSPFYRGFLLEMYIVIVMLPFNALSWILGRCCILHGFRIGKCFSNFSRCNGKPSRTFGRLAWNMKLRCSTQQGVWWNPFIVQSRSAYCIIFLYIIYIFIYIFIVLIHYTYMYSLWRVISDGFYWVCSWAILFSSFWGKRSTHLLWRAKKLFLSATSRSSWWQLDSYFLW